MWCFECFAQGLFEQEASSCPKEVAVALGQAMAIDLSSCIEKWDVPEVRERIRENWSVFRTKGAGSAPAINIKDAVFNRQVLKPALVAMRAGPRDNKGFVHLFTIAEAERVFLGVI